MKIKDLRIGTQLRLGLGIILLLVIAMSVLAKLQTDAIWLQTSNLYEHPLTVRLALGALDHDFLFMQGGMKDLALGENEPEIGAVLQEIEVHRADAARALDIISDRYLGPRGDVAGLRREFDNWNAVCAETVRLLRTGKSAEVLDRLKPAGAGGVQSARFALALQRIDSFALGKGDQLLQEATALDAALDRYLVVLDALILLAALIVSWFLLRGIKSPLQRLTAATAQFRQGDLGVRCDYRSANELGELSASFNSMAEAIESTSARNQQMTQLSTVMLREEEVRAFCRAVLQELLLHTGSQVGAVYFLNDARTTFELFDSIGLGAGGRAAFSATEFEGELGAALATRQIQQITAIPAETRFTFATVSGEFRPREILTIPVPADHHVAAVISLASVRVYDAASLQLVHDLWALLTARLNGVLAFRQAQRLAERLEHQNQALDAQKRELAAQTDELTQQNIELEMQKRELGEANRLKSAFLSNMSHELRTPLNSVIALAGVLNRRLEKTLPKEEHGYLDVIERNGKHLLALINNILDLSRIEAGREELRLSRFSLRELTGEVVAMLEPLALEKGIELRNLVPDDLPLLISDSDKCLHILQNLVGNAVKFTATGAVEISARQVDGELLVAVRDTGIGIAAAQFQRIFDEFRQVDDSTSRSFGGAGLGLAIAKKFALLLNGDIALESAPGKGSTFTLRLPLALELPAALAPETRPPARSRTAAAAAPPPGDGRTILVVEDSDPAVVQLTDILTRQGYRLQVARNGNEALAQIESSLPDAMILDLMMPEVDGFQVLRELRGVERTAQVPVLILTAKHVTQEELSFLKGNQIHQLILKGDVNRHELLAAVASMVGPAVDRSAPTARAQAGERRPAKPGKPVVLVVEDNPDSLLTAKALLRDRYQVLEATDGQAGLERARRHLPDIILLDISMPVMDGLEALQEIRADDTLRHLPVIALTASAMKGDRETILAYGFDGYLSKPLDAAILHETLRRALD